MITKTKTKENEEERGRGRGGTRVKKSYVLKTACVHHIEPVKNKLQVLKYLNNTVIDE